MISQADRIEIRESEKAVGNVARIAKSHRFKVVPGIHAEQPAPSTCASM